MKQLEFRLSKNEKAWIDYLDQCWRQEEEYSFIEKLAEESLNPDYITIDIAHGHANSVIDMIQHIKNICLKLL